MTDSVAPLVRKDLRLLPYLPDCRQHPWRLPPFMAACLRLCCEACMPAYLRVCACLPARPCSCVRCAFQSHHLLGLTGSG